MTRSEHLPLPPDLGAVPASLRDAYAAAATARRAVSPGAGPDDADLDTLLDDTADEEARLTMVDRLLASRDGAETLAHLVAARLSTAAPTAEEARAPVVTPTVVLPFAARPLAAPGRRITATLKPILLAASLMMVAGSSWYVYTLPPQGDEVRAAGAEVDLQQVPLSAAARPVTLIWKPRKSVSRYRVEILNASDDPVFTLETNDTTVVVPGGTLAPGTYRWWVRSRATDGTEIRSRVEKLTIR